MSSVSERPPEDGQGLTDGSEDVPRRLRKARERAGLSLRQLAQRLEISASALSQIETGKSRPSVRTLYAVVSELNLSLDELFDHPGNPKRPASATARSVPAEHLDPAPSQTAVWSGQSPLQKADRRARLELDSGVLWDRLTSQHDAFVDFLHVTYTPGSASNAPGTLVRHTGSEYGIVLSGAIDVTVGFETYHCEVGDSISFSSEEPHLLANNGDAPATAIWIVVGRRANDPRKPTFDGA